MEIHRNSEQMSQGALASHQILSWALKILKSPAEVSSVLVQCADPRSHA